jgi:hypothetical protein
LEICIPLAVYVCNSAHEEEIVLPSRYNTFKTQLFGIDLATIMGQDGSRGLPRCISDSISYIRTEGKTPQNPVHQQSPLPVWH